MDEERIEKFVQKVQSNKKYQSITPDLVKRLVKGALRRGLTGKSVVKDVRNKLHQIGGAYFRRNPDFDEKIQTLEALPHNPDSEGLQHYCKETMQAHASTAERLPILEEFYRTCLAPVAPVISVLDLACGMNPLAAPWMPLADDATYIACDIYLDMLALVEKFLAHISLNGCAAPCDLTAQVPEHKSQVALLLKSIPCLEQVEKPVVMRLLQSIQADHILVSFPVRSLGGRQKGMPNFYRDHFYETLSGTNWQIQEFAFDTELAFLVTK